MEIRLLIVLIVIGLPQTGLGQFKAPASLKDPIERLDLKANDLKLDKKTRAKAALESGRLYLQAVRWNPEQKKSGLEIAAKRFEIAAKIGTQEEQTLAFNNCGATFLKLGEFEKAGECFKKCDLKLIPKEHQHVLHYNRGLVFYKLKKNKEAVAEFSRSYQKNPKFLRAAKRVWDLAFDDGDRTVQRSGFAIVDQLVQNGQADYVLELTEDQFKKGATPHGDMLMTSYVNALSARPISPEQFLNRQFKKLHDWETEFGEKSGTRGCAMDLEIAYKSTELRWKATPIKVSEVAPFTWWTNRKRNSQCRVAFSRLLKNLGDFYAGTGLFVNEKKRVFDPGRFENSLNRYLIAWSIDPGNFAASEAAAAVILEYKTNKSIEKFRLLDEEQERQIENRLTEITEDLFAAKTTHFFMEGKSQKDFQQLQGMHVLLGRIYEQSDQIGSINEPQSAVFQYEMALRIADKVGNTSTGDIHQRLANVYLKTGKKDLAVSNLSKSIDWQLQHGSSKTAESQIQQLETLDRRVTIDRTKFEDFRNRLNDLKDKGPGSRFKFK